MSYLHNGRTKMNCAKENNMSVIQSYIGLPKEIYILFISKIINSLGRFIGPLLTLILTKKIGMSSTVAGALITIAMVLQAPCVLIGGRLADTLGRKKVICIFFGLSALTFLSCIFMPVTKLLAYTLILGACFSSFSGSAYDAMITDYTDVHNRQAAFSLLYMGTNVGAAIAPVVGGLLFKSHLKILFLGDAVTTFIAVILITLFVQEHESVRKRQEQVDEYNETVKQNVFVVLRETPILIIFALILSIYSFVYEQFGFGIPLGMDSVFGDRGAELFGMVSSINALIVIFFTPFLIHITKSMKVKNVLAMGGLSYAGCFLVMAVSSHLYGYIVGIVLLTIGEILCAVNAAAFVANIAKSTHLGRINSVVSIIREMGACLSPIVIGSMLDVITIQQAFMVVGIIAMVGAMLMFGLKDGKSSAL